MTLEGLMEGFAASHGVRAKFVEEKHLSLLVEPLQSEGAIYFMPPHRLAREIVRPVPSALIVNGNSLATRTPGEINHVDLAASDVARHFVESFIVLFSGDLDELQRRYEVVFEATGRRWRMELVPRQSVVRHLIAQIRLLGEGLALREMEIIETQGDRTTTRFAAIDSDHRFDAAEATRLFGPAAADGSASLE